MADEPTTDASAAALESMWDPAREALWRAILTGESPLWRRGWRFRRLLPGRHRCKNCNAPFDGPAALLMRWTGRGRYNRNPRFCDF